MEVYRGLAVFPDAYRTDPFQTTHEHRNRPTGGNRRSGFGVYREMSIAIIRTFVRLRQLIENNKDIAARVEKLERGHARTASVIELLVEDIDRLAH
jgi:hypothetical protein